MGKIVINGTFVSEIITQHKCFGSIDNYLIVKGLTFNFYIFESLPPHPVNDVSHSQRFIYHLFVF